MSLSQRYTEGVAKVAILWDAEQELFCIYLVHAELFSLG